MPNKHTTPIILAQALDAVSTTALLQVGTVVKTDDGGEAVYVQATSGVSTYNAVVINVDYTAQSLSAAEVTDGNATGSREVAWAQTSIASGSFGWVQKSGRPKGKLAANAADRVPLFATTTTGTLDDATVSAAFLAGVVSKTTIATATAVTLLVPNGALFMNWSNPA